MERDWKGPRKTRNGTKRAFLGGFHFYLCALGVSAVLICKDHASLRGLLTTDYTDYTDGKPAAKVVWKIL
jgi:hypothetical protein